MAEYNLPERVEKGIAKLAEEYDIDKVILFGSRARGDNRERSDIDIAISGGDCIGFSLDADERLDTLLMFDIINLDGTVQNELLEEIERDGVIIYKKSVVKGVNK